MDKLYPAPKWTKYIANEKTIHSTKDKRTEAVWTNYNPSRTEREHCGF